MINRTARTARRFFGVVADAARSIVAPAALVQDKAHQEPATTPAPATAPDPTDLFTDEDMPADTEIRAAARAYSLAVEDSRRADRSKRAARKLLSRLPSGIYSGGWKVYRKPSARMTPDLEAIGRILREHGINEIPMKPVAASLVVDKVDTDEMPEDIAQLAAVAA